jgi:small-conductance mechanosensitive channel
MDWLTRPVVTIGRTYVNLVSLAEFLAALVIVIVAARFLGRLVGSRLLAYTAMSRGMQYALGRITYYAVVVIGLMIALQTSGIEMGSLTVVLGALGVGVGFGLQTIVNNFVSGLILLAERSVEVGDWIEVGGTGGRVERIGARSLTIITSDNIAMIVPNADLVTNKIVNWSHGDPKVRFRVPVGVAYGSDIERVCQALLEVAATNPIVLPHPAPEVFFHGVGDSSLNLELVVWAQEVAPFRFNSSLYFAIEAAFRRHGIEIPFPQRDVHLRDGGARCERPHESRGERPAVAESP